MYFVQVSTGAYSSKEIYLFYGDQEITQEQMNILAVKNGAAGKVISDKFDDYCCDPADVEEELKSFMPNDWWPSRQEIFAKLMTDSLLTFGYKLIEPGAFASMSYDFPTPEEIAKHNGEDTD